MLNLVRKELKLSIHPFFYLLPLLTGSLILIPQWPYMIALMYFFWISVPNIYSSYNTQSDILFSSLLPINREDIVRSKYMSMMVLELMHIFYATIFLLIRNSIFGGINFLLDPNMAFIGISFIMYTLFNICFQPLYFRTGYKFGLPLIISIIGVLIFASGIETVNLIYPKINHLLESPTERFAQFMVLLIGGGLFFLSPILSIKQSTRNFNRVEI